MDHHIKRHKQQFYEKSFLYLFSFVTSSFFIILFLCEFLLNVSTHRTDLFCNEEDIWTFIIWSGASELIQHLQNQRSVFAE